MKKTISPEARRLAGQAKVLFVESEELSKASKESYAQADEKMQQSIELALDMKRGVTKVVDNKGPVYVLESFNYWEGVSLKKMLEEVTVTAKRIKKDGSLMSQNRVLWRWRKA